MKKILKMATAVAFAGCLLTLVGCPREPAEPTMTEGFVQIPAASITGEETWSPSSQVFVSGRKLEIASFYMCEHEVTYEEFYGLTGIYCKDNSWVDGDVKKSPWRGINFYRAIAYCNKRSAKEGLTPCYNVEGISDWANINIYQNVPKADNAVWNNVTCNFSANGYRLPTEAEWEWAARGGGNYTYAGSDNVDEVAWYETNSGNKLHEVKQKKANAYGLYDMSGNVMEWCWDWYSGSISSNTPATGPASGSYRLLRGGDYYNGAYWSGVSVRDCKVPYFSGHSGLGFRLVRSGL